MEPTRPRTQRTNFPNVSLHDLLSAKWTQSIPDTRPSRTRQANQRRYRVRVHWWRPLPECGRSANHVQSRAALPADILHGNHESVLVDLASECSPAANRSV